MKKISELIIGQDFYFPKDKGTIYTFLSFTRIKWNGLPASAKCVLSGKLYPVYISAKHEVIVLNNPSKINNEKVF